ncbi:MAG TPA: hypothetical protein V6C50_07715 [Crinalium sp.]
MINATTQRHFKQQLTEEPSAFITRVDRAPAHSFLTKRLVLNKTAIVAKNSVWVKGKSKKQRVGLLPERSRPL